MNFECAKPRGFNGDLSFYLRGILVRKFGPGFIYIRIIEYWVRFWGLNLVAWGWSGTVHQGTAVPRTPCLW